MSDNTNKLKRAHLTDSLRDFAAASTSSPPGGGWVRAIREAISMTQGQLATRLGISRQSVQDLERAEAERRITLESLDRLAAAMRCRVVHALVPLEGSLDEMRAARARVQAEKMMGPVAHSMAMESQAVPSNIRERQLQIVMDELLSGAARNLWR